MLGHFRGKEMSKYFPEDCSTCKAKEVCQMKSFPDLVKISNTYMVECPHWENIEEGVAEE